MLGLPSLLVAPRSKFQRLKQLASKDIHHVDREDYPGTVRDDPEKKQRHCVVVPNVVEA